MECELRCDILFVHANRSRSGCFIASQAFVLVKFSLCQDENSQENFLPIFVSEETEEAKIWWNQQVQRRTISLAPDLSDCGSHCFKLRRMVEGTLGHKSHQ